jgi:hypothetical protein
MRPKRFLVPVVSLLILATWAQAQSGPPTICKPCLFYSGDLSPSDLYAEAFENENTLSLSAGTYGAIRVPYKHTVLVEGVLFQTIVEFGDRLDPDLAEYQIRTNIVGTGGTVIASGAGPAYHQSTGRQFNGNPEYTIAVQLNPPVQLSGGDTYPGTEYWFNLVPFCTLHHDPTCQTVRYFVSNTAWQVNNYNLSFGVPDSTVFIWPNFDYDYSLCYDEGYNGQQCAFISFGLMGKVLQ